MAHKLDNEEMVSLEELVVSHSYEMVALVTVLERKGILMRHEIVEVIAEMQKEMSQNELSANTKSTELVTTEGCGICGSGCGSGC